MRRVLPLLIVLLLCVAVIPAQAQSPALTFDYATSPYTASPYSATYPTPTGHAVPVYVAGTGYRLTSSFLSDGYTNGNRSCVKHSFGGTMTSVTRFVAVTSGPASGSRLTLTMYDASEASVYSQFWDSNPGTRDVSVTENGVRSVTLCLTGTANVNNPNFYIVSLAMYGTFQPDGVDFDADPIEGAIPLEVTFTNTSICSEGDPGWQWDFDGDTEIDSTDEDPAPFTYSEVGTYFATLTAMCNGVLDDHTEMITVQGDLTLPLAGSDMNDVFGVFDKASRPDTNALNFGNALSPDPNLVVAVSDRAGDYVYAVTTGTVLSIDPLGVDCFGLNATLSGYCLLRFDPQSFEEWEFGGSDLIYDIKLETLYKVRIGGDDGYIYEYVVENPQAYLTIGLTIRQGCILGETFTFTIPTNTTWNLIVEAVTGIENMFEVNVPQLYGAFVSRVEADGDLMSVYPEMELPAQPSSACNINPDEVSCVVDPNPANERVWAINGGGTYLAEGGVELQPNAQLYTMIPNLVVGTAYGARVTVDRGERPGNAISRIAITVGSASEGNIDLTTQYAVYEVDPVAYDDEDDPTVTVTNLSSHPIRVERICVHDGTSDPRPDTCAFSNYSFDDGLSDWGYNEDITNGLAGGEIAAFNGGTFYQNLQLYPYGAAAHTYRIYVKVHLISELVSAYPAATLRLDYTYGTHTGYLLSPSSGATYAFSNWAAWAGREVTFELDLNIDAVEEHNFYVAATIAGASDVFVSVREICVDDAFEGDWGGGLPPFYQPSCNLVTPPADGDGVGTWTFFLWQSLDRFFQCDLMDALNRIILAVNRQISLMRWTVMYYQQIVVKWINWSSDSLVPWLNGHLHNIAVGQSTTIISGDQQCDNLFCLLTSGIDILRALIEDIFSPLITGSQEILRTLINALTQAPYVLYNVLADLIGLLLSVVTAIFAAWQSVMRWFGQIINAWNNAEPVAFGFMPTCDVNPRDNAICIIFWVIQNTVGSGAGTLFIPILIGYATIDMIIDAAKRVQKAITRMRA